MYSLEICKNRKLYSKPEINFLINSILTKSCSGGFQLLDITYLVILILRVTGTLSIFIHITLILNIRLSIRYHDIRVWHLDILKHREQNLIMKE